MEWPIVLLCLIAGYYIFISITLWNYRREKEDFDQTRRPLDNFPGVSVLVPIKGPVEGISTTLLALLEQEYPAPLEIILAFQDANDPSLPEAKKIIADWKSKKNERTSVIILEGLPFKGFNPKNSNLVHGLEAAHHDWIFTLDIDTRLDSDHISKAIILTEDNFMNFVSAITVHEDPRSLGALLETIPLNMSLTSYFLFSFKHDKKPGPVNGAAHLFHRKLLDLCGGPEIILNVLTEDAVLEREFKAKGARGLLHPDVVRVSQPDQTLKGFYNRYTRWMMIARHYHPMPFIYPLLWFGFWTLLYGVVFQNPLALKYGMGMFAIKALSSVAFQILLDTPKRDWVKALIVPFHELLIPFLWTSTLFVRSVKWGGTPLIVQKGGVLTKPSS